MIAKFPFVLFVASFLALSAVAATTSQNVDITVTHAGGAVGSALTTSTFVNDSGSTLPAGSPVSFGQAFRYGDIMPGSYPLIRDAATHVALPGQQWDEVSTWRENAGNGSWRHAVWAAWLPAALAPGATYSVEFVTAAGSYSQSSHQALSALCSGPAAHDLKIHLIDVRNQNETARDSGDATFRLCDNIANVGRDAPRHLRAGNVYDEYVVSGMFVYTSGHKDPLLYAQCNVDIFTKASDGVSAGDIRHVCHVINAFMNVAAGSTGNAGNPGPAGFASDPQAVSYRPQLLDGSAVVMDWGGLDATINSADNPVEASNAGHCEATFSGPYCMHVPSSTGANTWYMGQAVRVSCSATCVGGLTNDLLAYVYPTSVVGTRDLTQTQYVTFSSLPKSDSAFLTTASQGTGTTSFSFRVQHYHWEAWQTLDWSGQDNWSPFGATARVTRKVYPALTSAEKLYWEETGMIIPLNLAQPAPTLGPSPSYGGGTNYEPMGRLNVIGFQGAGPRPDIGVSNEFAAQAWLTGDQTHWDWARLFTLGTSMHGSMLMINEATGRIPALNNGPPVGPGGNGNGGSYAALGAPMPQVTLFAGGNANLGIGINGMAGTPTNQPNPSYDITGGTFNYGTYLSHVPNFAGFTYLVFGDRHWLDLMRWRGNASYAQDRTGPAAELGQGGVRDNNAVFAGDGKTYHYYGLLTSCCQTRGSAWLMRDMAYPAAFGGDGDVERSYFHDFLVETSNYYPAFLAWMDGPGSTSYRTSINLPNIPGFNVETESFIATYDWEAAWLWTAWLHEPMGSTWHTKYQRYMEGVCGGQLAGAPPSFYCTDYVLAPAIHDGSYNGLTSQNGNQGPGTNGTDAYDFGNGLASGAYLNILTGGQVSMLTYHFTPGDRGMNVTGWIFHQGPLDQIGGGWYEVTGPIDNTVNPRTFYLKCPLGHAVDATCPTPGAAFTGFTRGGNPVVNEFNTENFQFHLQYDPGPGAGYADPNYDQYTGQVINGLHILGYSVPHAMADFAMRDGGGGYNTGFPSMWWDPTVVIPGLPAAINGL